MTKQEQYAALAKMLPDKIFYCCDECGKLHRKGGGVVRESELLQLCQDARENVGEDYLKRVDFLNVLRGILADRLKRTVSDFDLLQATPEENIEALAKVKGIK